MHDLRTKKFWRWVLLNFRIAWQFPDQDNFKEVMLARAYTFCTIVAFWMAVILMCLFIVVLT